MDSDSGQSTRFQRAIERFDAENSRDPNQEAIGGTILPRELLYGQRLTNWVIKLAPEASEPLRLAARCQHICRWEIPRANYPQTKAGYLKWRNELKKFHADKAGEILREVGYEPHIVQKVQELNLKMNFPIDPDSRTLEDALCLVFLEFQLAELATRATEEKIVNAIKKSWQKMTPAGRAYALRLPFGPKEKHLIDMALAG